MRYLIALDIGIRNMGMCVYDFELQKIVKLKRCGLVDGAFNSYQSVSYLYQFTRQYAEYFDNLHTLLIERQMRCNMRILESILHALYYENTIILNPRCVKVHYGLSRKDYRLNKAAACEWCEQFMRTNGASVACAEVVDSYFSEKKRDDLSDAVLLLMYYLDTYSNQLE